MEQVKNWALSFLVTIGIVVLSTIPIPEVPELQNVPFIDKWVHFVMYGALTFAMWIDWWRCSRQKWMRLAALSFVYPTLLGGLMELVQAYLTTCRTGDWIDFLADAFGAALALVISLVIAMIVNKAPLPPKGGVERNLNN